MRSMCPDRGLAPLDGRRRVATMVDQTKVTSGFDVEFLMTEEFIRFFLLCSLDTGSIPWASESSGVSGTPPTPYRTVTIIHPPVAL